MISVDRQKHIFGVTNTNIKQTFEIKVKEYVMNIHILKMVMANA